MEKEQFALKQIFIRNINIQKLLVKNLLQKRLYIIEWQMMVLKCDFLMILYGFMNICRMDYRVRVWNYIYKTRWDMGYGLKKKCSFHI